MTDVYLQSTSLSALGIEHGLGTAASGHAPPEGLVLARQVHGCHVARVPPLAEGLEADALLTTASGVAVGVRTADCVPILLADPAGRGVAAVHAGWRGTALGIVGLAVRALTRATGARPDSLVAVIGPHIGPCCYEVDEPVRERIPCPEAFRPAARAGHYWLDLERVNRTQLEGAGVRFVSKVGECTFCTPGRYASYRRDGNGGRMYHYVALP